MDELRARIQDDLGGIIEGDLLFGPVGRAPYAIDAGLMEVEPLGAVAPRTAEDLANLVRYAAEHAIPLHARGAGTGLAGGCLGRGIVVDFGRHLRRIVEVRPESVVVQPGVVLDVLNAHLAPLGRRLGPDPAGSESCTIGGMIGGDAAGPRMLRYGTTADHVERLRVVLADGQPAELARVPWPPEGDEPADLRGAALRKLATILNWHADLIARSAARRTPARVGYALGPVATPGGIDLARLAVGSEGTLVLVTEATLKTVPIPSAQAVLLFPFGRLGDAAEAVVHCRDEQPTACDLHDWRTLRLARDADPLFRDAIPEPAEAVLVVEFEGDDPESVARRARSLSARLSRFGRLVADPFETRRRAEGDRLLNPGRAVEPLLMRARGRARPVPLLEEVAVSPEILPSFLGRLQAIMKGQGVPWTLSAQAAGGLLRARPFLDLSDPRDVARVGPLAAEVFEAVLEAGGSIRGESARAAVGAASARRQRCELDAVFREVKNAFDPHGLLNPGKVVGEEPLTLSGHPRARLVPAAEGVLVGALPVLAEPLRWPEKGREEHIAACNGCGACRTREPALRMCPTFRATGAEAASPRAQANLLRQIATGVLDPNTWGTEELRANANLCVHCNLCRSECPAGVDVSGLMLEAKAAHVEAHGLTTGDWLLSRVDLWSAWASRLPILFNALMDSRPARWALERMFGLSRHRRLPRAHRRSFLRRADRLGLTRPRPGLPGPRVAYFVDIHANYFAQRLAEAVVAVLQHAGVNVFVPRGQRGSGMPALVAGDLDHARAQLLPNLRVLGNAVRDGYTVVCSEPTAALMLRREALRLTDDLDAGLVAANTMDVGQYLAGLDARGQLPPPEWPLHAKVGYHQPCHLRALDVGTPGLDLIRRIPELEVEFIDRGCSGIAGTFGLDRRNFRTSLRAGRGLLSRLRDDDLELGATECGACRMQMEQGMTKRTRHPVELLSLSYGLNPSLRERFKEPKGKHDVG